MKKVVIFLSLAIFSYADVVSDAIRCDYYGCLEKYETLLKKLCDNGNKEACNTLSKNYYQTRDSSNGDYYACKAGVTEMCHGSETTDSNKSSETKDSINDESNTKKEPKICVSDEDRIKGCIEIIDEGWSHSIYPYKNGKLNGVGISEMDSFGDNYRFETTYKDGEIEGVTKSYKNGQLTSEMIYKDSKKWEGFSKEYHDNGLLKTEVFYKNGMRQGTQIWYNKSGNIEAEVHYTEGKPHGLIKYYRSNKPLWQITAQNGKLVNGKCMSGKALTNSHLTKVKNDIEKDEIDNWHTLCQ
ncbi:hypothetical protein [Helicobacter bilis]|uniref:toxin-antitoxin system YwqK family antitoxin n=1 Tax=Helicobacter bilis TaxID=37372 RepID=UPI002943C0EE|nr:hypothetical protein [Helicobacter bilis]